jgi:hypothetical protein
VFQLNAAWIFTVQSFSANNLDVSFARTAGQADFSGDRREACMEDNFLDFWGIFLDNR